MLRASLRAVCHACVMCSSTASETGINRRGFGGVLRPFAASSCFITFRVSRRPLVGRHEEHPACKYWVMRCWRGYLSAARSTWCAYSSADATVTVSSLASLKSRMVLPFSCHLLFFKTLVNGDCVQSSYTYKYSKMLWWQIMNNNSTYKFDMQNRISISFCREI